MYSAAINVYINFYFISTNIFKRISREAFFFILASLNYNGWEERDWD